MATTTAKIVLVTAALVLAAACDDDEEPAGRRHDAGAADTNAPGDLAPAADATADTSTDQGSDAGMAPDVGADSGGDMVADMPADMVAFMPLSPCETPVSYVQGSTSVGVQGLRYDPRCLRVASGTTVAIHASVEHPLQPASGGSPGNPIPPSSADARVSFPAPGFYPFLCAEHIDSGMAGVIWVTD
jgi:plastocyanin